MINYNEVQLKFNEVIEYSQGINNVKSDELFKEWSKNKSHFIEKWGGLTYELEEEVCFDRTEDEKDIMFVDFVSDICAFADKSEEVARFLKLQKEGLFQNKVVNRFCEGDIKINAGARISKSLKFFIEDKGILNKFQIRLSRIIQDSKITGKMVLSVHPLDFLSSSETAHNWHSCHSLDGEYRAGNLSYMVDKHTFMVYLKSNEESKLPRFPFEWNSKKWRMLLFLREDEQLIVRGREYPFSSDKAVSITTNMLGKFFDLGNFTDWTNVEDNIDRLMMDDIGSLHYNDCLNSPSYSPHAIFNRDIYDEIMYDIDSEELSRMIIGSSVECLCCGGEMISLSSTMMCDSCAGFSYCEYCGCAAHDDDLYSLGSDLVCEDCFYSHSVYCERCCEYYPEDEGCMVWSNEHDCYYCEECYEEVLKEEKEKREEREWSSKGEL